MASNKCMSDTCNMPLPRETILIGTQDETINGMKKKIKKESHKHISKIRDISIDTPPDVEYRVKSKIVEYVDET